MAFFNDEAKYQKAMHALKLVQGEYLSKERKADIVNDKGDVEHWRALGTDAGNVNKIDKSATLKALQLDGGGSSLDKNRAWLDRIGLTKAFLGDLYETLSKDPTQLIDKEGKFIGINDKRDKNGDVIRDKNGNIVKELSKFGGSQIKVLARYEGDRVANLSIMSYGNDVPGKDKPGDIPEFDEQTDGTIGQRLDYALNAVRCLAQDNNLDPKSVVFTGASLGGSFTNSFHRLKATLAGGFFKDSVYVAAMAPVISTLEDDGSIINLGVENDPVYCAWGYGRKTGLKDFYKQFGGQKGEDILGKFLFSAFLGGGGLTGLYGQFSSYKEAIEMMRTKNPEIFDEIKPEIRSGPNNVISFDDAYNLLDPWSPAALALKLLTGMSRDNTISSLGWLTHGQGEIGTSNKTTFERIHESVFHQQMDKDSVVVVSNLGTLDMIFNSKIETGNKFFDFVLGTAKWALGLTGFNANAKYSTWIEDKKTATSDHYGRAAFILGTESETRENGKYWSGNDFIRGGRGDDAIETLSGNDYIDLSSAAGLEHSK
ncbi:hypothetical protein FHS20_005445, partial [Phyllobacterium endophyticum]|nr:hypothetical protein [Phyllobacterium endophyticum]